MKSRVAVHHRDDSVRHAGIPVSLAAQEHPTKHHTYKLIDLGTLGGPNSAVNGSYPPMLNNHRVVTGTADTSTPCAYLGVLVPPAFKWKE